MNSPHAASPNSRPDAIAQPNNRTSQIDKPIVFFDGECNLCNGFVDLLLKLDPTGKMWIAPLQGETAAQLLPPLPNDLEAWSMFYRDKTGLYDQSDAALKVAEQLGGLWSIVTALQSIPQPIRNVVYRMVASNRYRWFGKRSTCRMPTEQERSRFLP